MEWKNCGSQKDCCSRNFKRFWKASLHFKVLKKIKNSKKKSKFQKKNHFKNNKSKMNHPNILEIYGFTENPFQIIMEFCEEGNLLDWLLKNKNNISNEKLMKIAKEICLGLDFIHQSRVLHLDLKLENIVKNWKIK